MKTFIVSVPEIHYQDVLVDAENKKEAIEIAKEGMGEIIENTLEYSHTSETENYHCEEN